MGLITPQKRPYLPALLLLQAGVYRYKAGRLVRFSRILPINPNRQLNLLTAFCERRPLVHAAVTPSDNPVSTDSAKPRRSRADVRTEGHPMEQYSPPFRIGFCWSTMYLAQNMGGARAHTSGYRLPFRNDKYNSLFNSTSRW